METSPTIGELAKALANAQLEFSPVIKDVKNPYYGQMYADLSSVIKATQPALAKHGLVVIQTPETNIEAQEAVITTRLCHASGEWLQSALILPATMQGKGGEPRFDAQSIGAATTYGKRYGYQGIVGVCAEADDDGNALVSTGNGKSTIPKSAPPPRPSQKAAEITQLKQSLVDVCKMLNKAGDKPEWHVKRLDEFAVQEFGAKADSLELEPLRELLKKLSLKLDELKSNAKHAAQAQAEDNGVPF